MRAEASPVALELGALRSSAGGGEICLGTSGRGSIWTGAVGALRGSMCLGAGVRTGSSAGESTSI